jgi:tetratricopeptide (TPR) repeat protein
MEAYNSFNTLYQQGRYSEAEPYAKEALRLGTEEFGPDHPNTATFLNNLALLYQAQGRYSETDCKSAEVNRPPGGGALAVDGGLINGPSETGVAACCRV